MPAVRTAYNNTNECNDNHSNHHLAVTPKGEANCSLSDLAHKTEFPLNPQQQLVITRDER